MRLSKVILIVLGMSLAGYAADDPFAGKWKLNVAKSKYRPGPAPKSQTVTIDPDGKVNIETVDAQDKNLSWSYGSSNGKEAPITGLGSDSSVMAKQSSSTVEHTWKFAGKTATGKGTLSKDGKTMTYRFKGASPAGQRENNVQVYDKEQ